MNIYVCIFILIYIKLNLISILTVTDVDKFSIDMWCHQMSHEASCLNYNLMTTDQSAYQMTSPEPGTFPVYIKKKLGNCGMKVPSSILTCDDD